MSDLRKRAQRFIDALENPGPAFKSVPEAVRQSARELIEELLAHQRAPRRPQPPRTPEPKHKRRPDRRKNP